MNQISPHNIDELVWVGRLVKLEENLSKPKRNPENGRGTVLHVRVSPEVKEAFKSIYYSLKGEGIIQTQEDLIRALIEIYRTRKYMIKRVLTVEFK